MGDATRIIEAIQQGDSGASDRLVPLVYDELRRIANRRIAAEAPGHTLQATALVNEAYLRLVDVENAQHWDGQRHFFAAASEAMRRILVDHARRKKCAKRGGNLIRQDLIEADIHVPVSSSPDHMMAVHEALDDFAIVDPDAAELVKMRFFAGMTIAQAAEVLGISSRTANTWWTYAKAWLVDRIGEV